MNLGCTVVRLVSIWLWRQSTTGSCHALYSIRLKDHQLTIVKEANVSQSQIDLLTLLVADMRGVDGKYSFCFVVKLLCLAYFVVDDSAVIAMTS